MGVLDILSALKNAKNRVGSAVRPTPVLNAGALEQQLGGRIPGGTPEPVAPIEAPEQPDKPGIGRALLASTGLLGAVPLAKGAYEQVVKPIVRDVISPIPANEGDDGSAMGPYKDEATGETYLKPKPQKPAPVQALEQPSAMDMIGRDVARFAAKHDLLDAGELGQSALIAAIPGLGALRTPPKPKTEYDIQTKAEGIAAALPYNLQSATTVASMQNLLGKAGKIYPSLLKKGVAPAIKAGGLEGGASGLIYGSGNKLEPGQSRLGSMALNTAAGTVLGGVIGGGIGKFGQGLAEKADVPEVPIERVARRADAYELSVLGRVLSEKYKNPKQFPLEEGSLFKKQSEPSIPGREVFQNEQHTQFLKDLIEETDDPEIKDVFTRGNTPEVEASRQAMREAPLVDIPELPKAPEVPGQPEAPLKTFESLEEAGKGIKPEGDVEMRGMVKSIANDETRAPALREQIVDEPNAYYKVKKNFADPSGNELPGTSTNEKASRIVTEFEEDETVKIILNQEYAKSKGFDGADRVAAADKMIDKLAERGDTDKALLMAVNVAQELAEAGQMIQARAMRNKFLTKQGVLTMAAGAVKNAKKSPIIQARIAKMEKVRDVIINLDKNVRKKLILECF